MNGSTINQPVQRVPGYDSSYVLVQTMTGYGDERQAVELLKNPEYLSNNTYLGRYDGRLEVLTSTRQFVFVEYYPTYLKSTPLLKQFPRYGTCQVDVTFHRDVVLDSKLRKEIALMSRCPPWDILFLKHGARLRTQGFLIESIATIDSVRCIKMVGEVVACENVLTGNDAADDGGDDATDDGDDDTTDDAADSSDDDTTDESMQLDSVSDAEEEEEHAYGCRRFCCAYS